MQVVGGQEVVVLDGGLATTLADRGHVLDDELWSARLLLDDPDAVRDVHTAFLTAGAEVVTTASYQLAARSLAAAGRDPALADELLARSVTIAREAADAYAADTGRRAAVAASVGPYGAVLADGSEYRGRYGRTVAELTAFHAPRVAALAAAGPDLLAVETVPSGVELVALAPLLREAGIPTLVSMTLGPDGTTTPEGQPLAEALGAVTDLEVVVAVGVNCCPPRQAAAALERLGDLPRPLAVQPNVGDRWDAARRRWVPGPGDAEVAPQRWLELGARYVGGCCGTGPDQLARLAASLR